MPDKRRNRLILPSTALLLATLLANSHASQTTLIDSAGHLQKAIPVLPPTKRGIVALLTGPSASSLFPETDRVTLSDDSDDGIVLLTSPGASLESTSLLERGVAAAASGVVASSVVLTGVTAGDVEAGLSTTRHGRTLGELFAAAVRSGGGGGARKLIVAVEGGEAEDKKVKEDVGEIFGSVAVAACVEKTLGEFFDVEVMIVRSPEDAAAVMNKASAAASESAPVASDKTFAALFTDVYNDVLHSPNSDPTPVAEAILACNDAYSRASRMSRAKLALWKHRASRGLLVDNFGSNAESLLKRTLDLFDRDTMVAAGMPGVGEKRLEIRSQLQERSEKMVKDLYALQMGMLEKSTLKKFNGALLRSMGKDVRSEEFFENNAVALREAAFAFERAASTLEVSSLALTKSKAIQDMTGKLNNALMTFPDSPAAKIRAMKKVERTVSKKKKPSEGSVDVALDLVAMIRPDGFGNFQGFAGYQLGPHSITVGVHNDADDPQVISSFGGVRPPFIRVQPKLKLDVEL
ncbi:hypothetical protein ACHAWX_004221 [Stephanocyclus meneghinianus]